MKMPSELVVRVRIEGEGDDMSLSKTFRAWFLKPITDKLREMSIQMANEAQVLNQVATELADNVFPGVQALVTENASLRADKAALQSQVDGQAAEEQEESEAVTNVVAATGRVSELLRPTEAPTPDPVVVEEPAVSDGE